MLKYIKAFAIGCFIIPILTVTVSYLISIHLDLVPKCIPFFEGCTSISRTGRYEPVKYYFKFFMFVYVLFLFFYWYCLIGYIQNENKILLYTLSFFSLIFLILYLIFLGEGRTYEFFRRIGIYIYILFIIFTQYFVSRRIIKNKDFLKDKFDFKFVKLKNLLSLFLIIIGILLLPILIIKIDEYPNIKNPYKQVFSPQTAYQVTSLLEGVIKRGTGKKLKKLKLNLAGKTGTTNENTDAWFIGYTSNLVIGVYVGMDNPEPLGKFETGSKAALPIFENFVKKAIKKSDARPFKVADGITMMVVDPSTGEKANFNSKNTIMEAYKSKNVVDGKIINLNNNRLETSNILEFY